MLRTGAPLPGHLRGNHPRVGGKAAATGRRKFLRRPSAGVGPCCRRQ